LYYYNNNITVLPTGLRKEIIIDTPF